MCANETDTPEDRELEALAGAVSRPAPPAAAAGKSGRPMSAPRKNKMAIAGLICSIASLASAGLLFTPLFCFTGLAVVGLAFAGCLCSVMGLQQARLCRSGRGIALAGLIVSLVPILLTIFRQLLERLVWHLG